MSIRRTAAVVLPLVLATSALSAAPALAKGGDAVKASGSCSGAATWKLKAAPDNARIQVEFEVDVNRVGQVWTWSLRDNGVLVTSGRATTVAPSGSFSVNRLIANKAGTDTIRFRSTSVATGQVCTGAVTL